MARVILGVTGSVAAIRTPALWQSLRSAGHEVRVVATGASLHFFDRAIINETRPAGSDEGSASRQALFTDADEWRGSRYERGEPIPHIEFRKWADILVVAPLDANTLAKFALGLSDNFLTCLYRAWDFEKPVILAPAMNTFMWESAVTLRHLRQIFVDHHFMPIAESWTLESAPVIFSRYLSRIVLMSPQSKVLACGDFGVGAMAEVDTIVTTVHQWLQDRSAIDDAEQASERVQ